MSSLIDYAVIYYVTEVHQPSIVAFYKMLIGAMGQFIPYGHYPGSSHEGIVRTNYQDCQSQLPRLSEQITKILRAYQYYQSIPRMSEQIPRYT